MCGMPQLSRVIVTCCASRCSRAYSLLCGATGICHAGGAAALGRTRAAAQKGAVSSVASSMLAQPREIFAKREDIGFPYASDDQATLCRMARQWNRRSSGVTVIETIVVCDSRSSGEGDTPPAAPRRAPFLWKWVSARFSSPFQGKRDRGDGFSTCLAKPSLRPTQHRHADVAAHVELLAVVAQRQLDLVGLAVVRVENLAAVPHIAILFHAPHDDHSVHRLVVAFAGALLADRMRALVGKQHLFDHALQRAVRLLGDFDDGFRFAGGVVDLRPGADRRGVVRGAGRGGQQQGEGYQCGAEGGAHGSSPWDVRLACAMPWHRSTPAQAGRVTGVRAGGHGLAYFHVSSCDTFPA